MFFCLVPPLTQLALRTFSGNTFFCLFARMHLLVQKWQSYPKLWLAKKKKVSRKSQVCGDLANICIFPLLLCGFGLWLLWLLVIECALAYQSLMTKEKDVSFLFHICHCCFISWSTIFQHLIFVTWGILCLCSRPAKDFPWQFTEAKDKNISTLRWCRCKADLIQLILLVISFKN